MIDMTREEIIGLLKENICQVKFTKKNGDLRNMVCTLRKEYLPGDLFDNLKEVDKEQTHSNVVCWDVEADGFRSFKVDSVIDLSMGGA